MTGDDELDPAVARELARFRREAAEAFPPAPPAAVFAAARRRTFRHGAAVGVAAAVAVAGVLAGSTMAIRATTTSAPTPPANVAPTGDWEHPYREAPVTADGPERGHLLAGETVARVREMTVTLPQWPGSYQEECPGGTYTFRDGVAPVRDSGRSESTGTYAVLRESPLGLLVDVTGDGVGEVLVSVGCSAVAPTHEVSGLLALQPEGDGFRALGYVMAASDEVGDPQRFFPDAQRQALAVDVRAPGPAPESGQRRYYRWDGAEFRQVGGPTSFPGDPGGDARTLDPRNWSFLPPSDLEVCAAGEPLVFVEGAAGLWSPSERPTEARLRNYTLNGYSRGMLDVDGEARPELLATVRCYPSPLDGNTVYGVAVSTWVYSFATGEAVIHGFLEAQDRVLSHRVVDGIAEVTVDTADAGREVRRYAYRDSAWERTD